MQQILLGSGAGGESYWIKSIRPSGTNIDMRGNGSGQSVMSPDGTDDGNLYFCTGSASQSYPTNTDGVHMFKFDKDGTISLKKSFYTDAGYHQFHTGLDSSENLYIGLHSGRIIKFNSSFVEQARKDIDKMNWEKASKFIFEGNNIHVVSDGSSHSQSSGRKIYHKLSNSTLEPQNFGDWSNDTRHLFATSSPGELVLKDGKFYMLITSIVVDWTSYHDILVKFDYTGGSWANSNYPFHFNNDVDWSRRLSKQDGSTSHQNSPYTRCLVVDDNGDIYTAGPNAQYGSSWLTQGERHQFSKLNSSGTTQWFRNIARSADGDGFFDWNIYYGFGGPRDIAIKGDYLYSLNQGKNNTQTNKSGNVHDYTILKMNKSNGNYVSSYSIANETINFETHSSKREAMQGALWTDTAIYFTTNVPKSTSNRYESDRTLLFKLPIDGGVNGSYTLDGQTIKISDNDLSSNGSLSSSNKTWTNSGGNLGKSRNNLSNTSTSAMSAPTHHTASYTNTQLDL